MRAELPQPSDDVADAGDESQTQHFLASHENAEHVAPAEPGKSEENDGVGKNLRRIDEVETARKGAEQTDYGVRCQVERERQRQGAHFVEGHDSKLRCLVSGVRCLGMRI